MKEELIMEFDYEQQKEAFEETCSRYFNIKGEQVDRAFVFYITAISHFGEVSKETMEWAKSTLKEYNKLDNKEND